MDSDRIEGKAKEVEGTITGDESREAEGKAQGNWGETKDKADDAWDGAKDKADDA
ncbi:MAG: CsbD family protein, partial [Actinobacteria bacterium]|nr:CsbD family protein [Actinomycetota bacterium]